MTTRNGLLNLDSPFFIGCNYWASHAGTDMWKDWRPEEVAADFEALAAAGIEVVRVFPLWPDFQPISSLFSSFGRHVDYRFGETRRPMSAAGRAGACEVMISRFAQLCEIAHQNGIKIIVALVTGYMSGRLFVPPALTGKDILTDPVSVNWQVRFVSYFVDTFKHDDGIVAWDLGNECNEMGRVPSREAAFVWTAAIANAVKARDRSRPLISGMHGLSPTGQWTMQDQADLTDILTTHPYPFWTRFADYDAMDTMRSALHATAESLFYGQLGGKPCFAEELGTMGPMVCSDGVAANFARLTMVSLWAHGTGGLLWWCSSDQTKLTQAPYDWIACEGELGLLREDRSVKPVLQELARLRDLIRNLPLGQLPDRIIDGVCILNSAQDHWAVAYAALLLAKQAGLEIAFCYEDQPLPDADLYILPCISGVAGVPKPLWNSLLGKVREGAILYLSLNDGYMLNFADVTGLRVQNRERRANPAVIALGDAAQPVVLEFLGDFRLALTNDRAEILFSEPDGNPAVSICSYGNGKVLFCALPLELTYLSATGASRHPAEQPYWQLYKQISQRIVSKKIARFADINVGGTEHIVSEDERYVILINYDQNKTTINLNLKAGWYVAADSARLRRDEAQPGLCLTMGTR